MPNGSAIITGILGCKNGRPSSNNVKSRVYAYDAEIFLGEDENANPQTALGLLHYFLPTSVTERPADDFAYYISGKIVSMPPDFEVGDGYSVDQYDMLIEAQTMFHVEDAVPVPPTVVLAGVIGEKFDKTHFNFDIMQYALGDTRLASFEAQGQVGNNRFDKLNIRLSSHCALTGVITGESVDGSDEVGKRIPFEFFDIGFISGDGGSKSSPRKGKSWSLQGNKDTESSPSKSKSSTSPSKRGPSKSPSKPGPSKASTQAAPVTPKGKGKRKAVEPEEIVSDPATYPASETEVEQPAKKKLRRLTKK